MLKNVYLPMFARKQKNFSGQLFFEKKIFKKNCKIFEIFFFENSGAHKRAQKFLAPKNTQIEAPSNFSDAFGLDFSARLKISQKSQKIRKKFKARLKSFRVAP